MKDAKMPRVKHAKNNKKTLDFKRKRKESVEQLLREDRAIQI